MCLASILLATITTAAEINALPHEAFACPRDIALTGTVTAVLHVRRYVLADDTGRTHIWNRAIAVKPRLGDRLAVIGCTCADAFRQEQVRATNVVIVGKGPLPTARSVDVRDIAAGHCDYDNVIVSGFVNDVFPDDIDPRWNYLILSSENASVYVTVPNVPDVQFDPKSLSRATVRLSGTVVPDHCGPRRFVGPHVEAPDFRAVTVLQPASARLPSLENVNHMPAHEVVRQGISSLEGTVRCVWGTSSLLLEGDNGDIHRVDLAQDATLPKVATRVRATGLPETDLYRINLSSATCQPSNGKPCAAPDAKPFVTRGVLPLPMLQKSFHGRATSFTGLVLEEPTPSYGNRAVIEDNGVRIAFDVSAVPELAEQLVGGARVRATGCGLLEMRNWRPATPPPEQREIVLVARTPDDLTVISNPPWWTPARLLAVIVALFVVIVIIAIWNRILNRIAERRGRLLVHEEVARSRAMAKTAERTRLAVELHDALSQALTGIACQIDATDRARLKNPARIAEHLEHARRTLGSCRNELRNCLWDLRNCTLDEKDAATAIRRTVEPHADEAELSIDVNVRRSQLPDDIFHEVLCNLRELVTNAVRHGKARHITIVGTHDKDTFRFSVTDDGCGFDPAHRPGCAEGHFGLLGVTERLARLGADLQITSAPGEGASFSFAFTLTKNA